MVHVLQVQRLAACNVVMLVSSVRMASVLRRAAVDNVPKDSLEQTNIGIHKQQAELAVPQVALGHAVVLQLVALTAAAIAMLPVSFMAPTAG